MAREVNRLKALQVQKLQQPGRYADGQGLYLQVDPSGAKRWVFVFQWHGARKEMGLGSLSLVSLAEAREERLKVRKQVYAGLNPIDERKRARAQAEGVTFGAFVEEWLAHKETGWKSEKHRLQWRSTLKTYAANLWELPPANISTEHVLKSLKVIWETKPETASRVRGRIERVLDAARVQGLREGENPARWKGHLDAILTKPKKLARGHHAALPYKAASEFMRDLKLRDSLAARALEFTILTAARTSETLNAKWSEIDLVEKVWRVPAARMKAGKDHTVPLTDSAIVALGEPQAQEDWIFPGQKLGRPLSNMAMDAVLRRMGRTDITVHGFRSTFRDWAFEVSDHPRDVAEAALAHTLNNPTERAYRRGTALEKRRQLMDDWASYITRSPSEPRNR